MSRINILGLNGYYRELNPNRSLAILLVHAHPLDSKMWRYQHQALSRYRLILPDMIGYGQTHFRESPFPKTVYLPQQVLYLRLLLDTLNLSRVHLIGLSMGGEIITEFARLFPDLILSLTLCANIPRGETPQSAKKRREMAAEIEKVGMEKIAHHNITRFINTEKHPPTSPLYRQLLRSMGNAPLKGAAAYTRGRAERRDNLSFLKTFKKPVLVIAGEKDPLFSLKEIKQMTEGIPNCELHVLHEVSHMVNMEDSERFNRILVNFYKRLKG